VGGEKGEYLIGMKESEEWTPIPREEEGEKHSFAPRNKRKETEKRANWPLI